MLIRAPHLLPGSGTWPQRAAIHVRPLVLRPIAGKKVRASFSATFVLNFL